MTLSEIGAGLNLTPNAVKACRALGIENDTIAVSCAAEFQLMRSWRSGRIISRQPLHTYPARFDAAHLTIHRADLLDIVARALPDNTVRLASRCTSVASDDRVATARFIDGREIEADIVVGADGIRSAVRTSLFGPETPRFTGCVCYRGLIPVSAVPPAIDLNDNTMWIGPHGHVVHYRVRRGELLNIVAHYDSNAWTEESWTHQCDRAELSATYTHWHTTLRRLFQCDERWYKWALYDREPLLHWSVRRATLLGDSAHAMLPYLAQGAAMAIEDGCVLANCVSTNPDDPVAALQRYEQLRVTRTRRAVLGSRARAKENHIASPWARLKRDVKFAFRNQFASDKTTFQAAWLYGYDVAAQSGSYPNKVA
jgi:salicylate hydroxylase